MSLLQVEHIRVLEEAQRFHINATRAHHFWILTISRAGCRTWRWTGCVQIATNEMPMSARWSVPELR